MKQPIAKFFYSKPLCSTLFILFFLNTYVIGQDYEWAFTAGKPHHTQPVAIRKDNAGDLYLATFTDSLSIPIFTQFEKRNAGQQLLWQKQIDGNAVITDLEINAAGHVVVTGYFKGTVFIDGNELTGVPNENTGFIFETDGFGSLSWVHTLNPLNNSFRPVDLFIANDGFIYLSSQVGGTGGLCAFHKLDLSGNILKSEFTGNFDNRTFSHILTDTAGNVYLSGTCGNFASFDTIPANPDFSYQNFLIKYDSSFRARWIITKNYITFDDNNRLCTDGKNLYWAFDDFDLSNHDTVRIIKINYSGEVLSVTNTPGAGAFLAPLDYSVDRAGNSVFFLERGVQMYLYRYDSLFNIVWQDTLSTLTSGHPLRNSLVCYDSSFYMQGLYLTPTLTLNNFTLTNPNAGTTYPSDVFVYKWGYFNVLPVSLLSFNAQQREEKVLLKWATENEISADKFILERSADGINFKATVSVKAKNGLSTNYESEDDISAWPYDIVYYRLKQVNLDGRYKLSKVLNINLKKITHIHIYPDPVTTLLTMQIKVVQAGPVDLVIYNTCGRKISKRTYTITKENELISLNTSSLTSGNYIISINGKTIRESLAFTKQ